MWVGEGYLYVQYMYTQKKWKKVAKKSLSLKQELYNDAGCTAVPLYCWMTCVIMNCEGLWREWL
jgi:hypothetical protein